MKDNKSGLEAELRSVEKAVRRIQNELAKLADENVYRIEYLLGQPAEKKEKTRQLDFEVKAIDQRASDEAMVDEEDEDDGDGEWIGFG